MSKKIKIILLSIVVVGIIGYFGFNYIIYGGERNIAKEETAFTVSSKDLSKEFSEDIEKSNKKYLEKAIAVQGIVTNLSGKELILDNSIICNLKQLDLSITKNQIITIKGRVVGYDDLMGELKIDQCSKSE